MYEFIRLLNEVTKNLIKPLNVTKSSQYKKGFKKHQNDKRVVDGINKILKYLIFNKDVPIEFKDHPLSNSSDLKGLRSAHIKGQKIVLMYKMTDKQLDLLALGTHSEIGTMK